jgi:hypothetical protein
MGSSYRTVVNSPIRELIKAELAARLIHGNGFLGKFSRSVSFSSSFFPNTTGLLTRRQLGL